MVMRPLLATGLILLGIGIALAEFLSNLDGNHVGPLILAAILVAVGWDGLWNPIATHIKNNVSARTRWTWRTSIATMLSVAVLLVAMGSVVWGWLRERMATGYLIEGAVLLLACVWAVLAGPMGTRRRRRSPTPCLWCGRFIQRGTTRCPHCDSDIVEGDIPRRRKQAPI